MASGAAWPAQGRIRFVPELPEVEALAADLRERATGRVIDRADIAEISVLKTYDPALTALRNRVITGTGRHGKFLDLVTGPAEGQDGAGPPLLHLIVHLARAGWLRWRDSLPEAPPRPGQGPAGVPAAVRRRRRLRPYRGGHPQAAGRLPGDRPGGGSRDSGARARSAGSGVYPGGPGRAAGRPRTQIKGVLRDQKIIAGIGNAYSDEVLHAARMSPFRLASSLSPEEVTELHAVIVAHPAGGDRQVRGAGRRAT